MMSLGSMLRPPSRASLKRVPSNLSEIRYTDALAARTTPTPSLRGANEKMRLKDRVTRYADIMVGAATKYRNKWISATKRNAEQDGLSPEQVNNFINRIGNEYAQLIEERENRADDIASKDHEQLKLEGGLGSFYASSNNPSRSSLAPSHTSSFTMPKRHSEIVISSEESSESEAPHRGRRKKSRRPPREESTPQGTMGPPSLSTRSSQVDMGRTYSQNPPNLNTQTHYGVPLDEMPAPRVISTKPSPRLIAPAPEGRHKPSQPIEFDIQTPMDGVAITSSARRKQGLEPTRKINQTSPNRK